MFTSKWWATSNCTCLVTQLYLTNFRHTRHHVTCESCPNPYPTRFQHETPLCDRDFASLDKNLTFLNLIFVYDK